MEGLAWLGNSRVYFVVAFLDFAFAVLASMHGCGIRSGITHRQPCGHFGESAEGIFDGVHANKWGKVERSTKEVGEAIRQLATAKIGPTDDFASAFGSLEKATKVKDRLETMVASNELTRLVAEACRNFEPPHPVEMTLLDYLGRELAIYTEKNDEAKIKGVVATIRAVWDKVRTRVEAKGGGKTARAFDTTVENIERNKDLKMLSPLSRKFLDQVDDLEGVFK